MKAFRKGSFSRQVLLTMLLVALVPMLLFSGVMLVMLVDRVQLQMDEQAATQMNQIITTLQQSCTALEGSVRTLAETPLVVQSMVSGNVNEQALYQAMLDSLGQNGALANYALYDVSGNRLMAIGNAPAGNRLSPDWGLLRRVRQADRLIFLAGLEESVVYYSAAPVHTDGGGITGYVVAAVTGEQFAGRFAGTFDSTGSLILLSPYWHLMYASQPSQGAEAVAALRAQLLDGQPLTGEGDAFHIYTAPDAQTGFTVVLQQPRLFTADILRRYYMLGGIITLLGVALSLWGTMLFSRRLAKPVGAISDAMSRVEHGDFSIRLKKQRNDELGRLARGFNRMMNEYQSSVERSVSRQRELNDTRIRMMQSQLNPHFLYNTLDSMRWLGVAHHAPKITSLATDLATILRMSISGEEFVSLQTELELVERYIEIQSIRFEDRFTCEIAVEERFQRCMVPKLMLQPLVENAILHGVAQQSDGYIKVWAEQQDKDLCVHVSDNGCGMPPDTVARINRIAAPTPGKHLGLYNVDTILRLHYGAAYGIHVTSTMGGGSCVSVRLPLSDPPTPKEGA